jgi:dTDP-4-dehydrorhamnose 3,5-epimerase
VKVLPTDLPGVLVVEPDVHRDSRGFFLESYHATKYRHAGIAATFVQDNHSRSVAGTIRGLHLQLGANPQAKLVRVLQGEIFDVAVDVRRGSPAFGRWVGVSLSAENFRQCYIPPGFAHGFAVVSPSAEVEYKVTSIYDPAEEIGIAWNDASIGVRWPSFEGGPLLSDRDRSNRTMEALADRLPAYGATNL